MSMAVWDTLIEFSEAEKVEVSVAEVRGAKLVYLGAELTWKGTGKGDMILQVEKRGKIIFDVSIAMIHLYIKQPLRVEKRDIGPEVISAGDILRFTFPKEVKASGWIYILIKEVQ